MLFAKMFDFNNMGWQEYLVVGGGGLVVLAIILYFLPSKGVKIPGIFAGIFGGLAAGAGIGMATLIGMGYEKPAKISDVAGMTSEEAEGMGQGGRGGAPQMNKGGGGMPQMKKGGPGGGQGKGGPGGAGKGKAGGTGGFTSSATARLTALITKLDILTKKPLTLELSADQKKHLQEQLNMLANNSAVDDAEANKRLEAILNIMQKDKDTLEAAGFNFSGQRPGGGAPAATGANPFKLGEPGQHLKALQDRLK
jgi:hypothetical protein